MIRERYENDTRMIRERYAYDTQNYVNKYASGTVPVLQFEALCMLLVGFPVFATYLYCVFI